MSRPRLFLTAELPVGSPCLLPLSLEDSKHVGRVLRVAPGEELDVVAPSGAAWRVRVSNVSRTGVSAEPLEQLPPPWRPSITLIQGVAKGEKMDSIVRQAVEVGAVAIVPVVTSRTVVRLDATKRLDKGQRWRRVAESAAKQAGREAVPPVADPVDFDDAVARLGSYDATIVLWEDAAGTLLSSAVRPLFARDREASVALVIGPEGGLSADEVARLESVGTITATLGPSIMRTETAAIVALGIAVSSALEMDAGAR